MGFNFFNRKAGHKYSLEDKVEAGVALTGTEIKSLRGGRMSLAEAYVVVRGGEAYLENAYIPPFQPMPGYDPRRSRKLLLHRSQLSTLIGKTSGTNLTLVPVRVYNRRGLAKVEIALAKGKRKFDHRRAIKERELREEARQATRSDKLAFQRENAPK
jgi:SsrA-binding protein